MLDRHRERLTDGGVRILVLGAYGVIGSAVTARLARDGHTVRAAGREAGRALRRLGEMEFVRVDLAHADTPQIWLPLLQGVDAVVHAAGTLQDGLNDNVRAVQLLGTRALYDACREAGVRRVIHISALGADMAADTTFMTTKAEADASLAASDLDWFILKPALVIARQPYGGTAMLKALSALPGFVPVPPGTSPIQTVDVDDIAETVARLVVSDGPFRRVFDLAHPTLHTLGGIASAYRAWLGLAPAPVVTVHGFAMSAAFAVGGLFAWLGWRNAARSNAGLALAAGVAGAPEAWMAATGIAPRSLAESLARSPAGVPDLWHARLFLLKPVIFAALALFWIVSGLVALGPGWAQAEAVLAAAGFGGLAPHALVATATLDILIGAAIALRRTAAAGLALSALVTLGYLVGGTLMLPDLWADALGPLVKTGPLLLLTAVAAALLPSR